LEGLKEAKTLQVAIIPPEITHMVMEKDRERLKQCNDIEVRDLRDAVFKF
jgi:Ran GTPase-activating protein (RanGAP) involved in mRNA processing and transport